jgi:hypothetical protein
MEILVKFKLFIYKRKRYEHLAENSKVNFAIIKPVMKCITLFTLTGDTFCVHWAKIQM